MSEDDDSVGIDVQPILIMLAEVLEETLNGKEMQPVEKTGFTLMIFPHDREFSDDSNKFGIVSNCYDRYYLIALMRDAANKLEKEGAAEKPN